jgi:hypothetical protein
MILVLSWRICRRTSLCLLLDGMIALLMALGVASLRAAATIDIEALIA